jgi:sec-independent protein translocase protein TatB
LLGLRGQSSLSPVFGVSFTELLLVAVVALIIVGPARLPGMLNTLGKWSTKLRRMLFDVRAQSGIDDILREEGLLGGLRELRQLRQTVKSEIATLGRVVAQGPPGVSGGAINSSAQIAGGVAPVAGSLTAAAIGDSGSLVRPPEPEVDPYSSVPFDRSREYPTEGCDAAGALPDDLWDVRQSPAPSATPEPDPAASDAAPHLGSATAEVVTESDAASGEPAASPSASAGLDLTPPPALPGDPSPHR